MKREKSGSIIGGIMDFIFGEGDCEDEAELEKSAAIIYEIMNFIFLHKNANNHQFDRKFFCSSIEKEKFSCAEAISFGVAQGWIEEIQDKIAITEYGFSYEKDFWKTFR